MFLFACIQFAVRGGRQKELYKKFHWLGLCLGIYYRTEATLGLLFWIPAEGGVGLGVVGVCGVYLIISYIACVDTEHSILLIILQ